MSALFRRCGCRDAEARTYATLPERPTDDQRARACPEMVGDPKHGSWSFRLSAGLDPVTRKRRQINGRSHATKREASAERTKMMSKLAQGKAPVATRETLAEYLPRWLERRQKIATKGRRKLEPTTVENYDRYIRNDLVGSTLGSVQLRDLRRAHVQAFIDELIDAERGATTIRRIVAVIQSALTSAVMEELIEESPARHLELPEVDYRPPVPWEPTQVGTFLDVAAEHRLGALFEVAIFTGLRRKELVGLTWDDVDLVRQGIRVRRSTTKTDAGERRVALDARTVGVLIAWQIAQAEERSNADVAWVDSGAVFTMEDGRPLKLQYATRLFQKLRKKTELPMLTFHGQRHQHASLHLAAGTSVEVVSKRLGHSSTAITADLYSHLMQSTEHDAATAAAAMVPPRKVVAHTVHAQPVSDEAEAVSTESGNGL